MEQFRIQIFSTSQLGGILDIGYTEDQGEVITDLLYVFGANFDVSNQTIGIDYKHQNTSEFQERLHAYISKYKGVSPPVQSLKTKFKKLKNDEWFFILPPTEFNTKQKYALERELNELNGDLSEVNEEQVQELFGRVIDNYELVTFDLDRDKKIKIGEGLKNKRICRFCKQKSPDVDFKKEAHAISEALGNKKLILNEECDVCNEFFDENVERDFIYYHDLARTMSGIKNKENKTPKMKGDNFSFSKEEGKNLSIAIVESTVAKVENKPPENVVFKTGNKIKLQNIYKALCKFSLSVIDEKNIQYFEDTIKWLKGEKEVEELPKIATLYGYEFFTDRPELTLFVRNNDCEDLPYLVCEFRFTFYMYIFIVPFASKDSKSFLSDAEYSQFLDCFQHIKLKGNFEYLDFSQNIIRELTFKINFQQKGD